MTLIELRDALAKATHGTFALECEIARLLTDWTPQDGPPRNYTVSIDAAVTLVPQGCSWDIRYRSHWNCAVHVGDDWATRHPDKHGAHFWKMANRGLYDIYQSAAAATPALALCLARVEHELAKART